MIPKQHRWKYHLALEHTPPPHAKAGEMIVLDVKYKSGAAAIPQHYINNSISVQGGQAIIS
jgi:hypothetical protein